jgi:hypothetical protein
MVGLHGKGEKLAGWLVVQGVAGLYLLRMDQFRQSGVEQYEPPTVRVMGSIRELTLMDKKYGPTDGYTLMGVAISNASP